MKFTRVLYGRRKKNSLLVSGRLKSRRKGWKTNRVGKEKVWNSCLGDFEQSPLPLPEIADKKRRRKETKAYVYIFFFLSVKTKVSRTNLQFTSRPFYWILAYFVGGVSIYYRMVCGWRIACWQISSELISTSGKTLFFM